MITLLLRMPEISSALSASRLSLSLDSPISPTRGFILSGLGSRSLLGLTSRDRNPRPSCSSPPAQAIQSICHSRDPQRSKPWPEAGRRRGATIPCKVPGTPPHLKIPDVPTRGATQARGRFVGIGEGGGSGIVRALGLSLDEVSSRLRCAITELRRAARKDLTNG